MPISHSEVEIANRPIDVTGPLTDTELRATPVPVSGPLTDAELRATPIPVSTTPSVATSSSVTVSTLPASTNTTILAANGNRRAAIIVVAKAATYIKFGATASSTSYTYKTATANTVIETEVWTGQIDAFGPAGEIAITELS